jgi:hypothetical protein
MAACMAGGAKVPGPADHQQKIRARPAQVQKIQVASMKIIEKKYKVADPDTIFMITSANLVSFFSRLRPLHTFLCTYTKEKLLYDTRKIICGTFN